MHALFLSCSIRDRVKESIVTSFSGPPLNGVYSVSVQVIHP